MKPIETTKELKEFCEHIVNEKFITVDLEFMREKTYYAQVCLIQVGSRTQCAIIDPLAKNIDLSDFWDIMQNPKIVKVFHACRQDVEIIYNMSGKIPAPLFDTQVAAMVCGFGEYVGYENLVHLLLGRELDKTCRLTNWHLRPLDEKQLDYAMSDVTHLLDVYEKLCEILHKTNRDHWFDDEIEDLSNSNLYEVNPDDAWLKIRHTSHNNKFLNILQQLAKWRELLAKKSNLPRQTIIKDECLVAIAASAPKSITELASVRNMRSDIVKGKLAGEILQIVKNALSCTTKLKAIDKENNISQSAKGLYEILKLMLKIISQQEGVVARLIATDDDLKNFSMFKNDKNNKILQGWRRELFGDNALLLREGKICISYNNKKKKIEFTQI